MVMPFSDDTANQVYNTIVKPLCEEMGLGVVRADEYATTSVIYNEIVRDIQESAIVIVDISGQNPNVMYELGIAHALRQPSTIILTHDEVAKLPFDIQHFRIIPYVNSIEGASQLKTKLNKTILGLQQNANSRPPTPPAAETSQESLQSSKEKQHEAVFKTFQRLSEWQRAFLGKAINLNKRQWQRYEMPSGFDVIWVPEIDVLISKRIVRQVNYDVFLIDDEFFETLQELDRQSEHTR